jgi:hypothetical protein
MDPSVIADDPFVVPWMRVEPVSEHLDDRTFLVVDEIDPVRSDFLVRDPSVGLEYLDETFLELGLLLSSEETSMERVDAPPLEPLDRFAYVSSSRCSW